MDNYNRRIDNFLESVSRIASDNPRKIVIVSTAIILLSIAGATQIRFSHYPLQWFPKDNVIRSDTEAIDRIMSLEPSRLYLTHYSRVDDLERLAADMHDCIDGFVAIAEKHRSDDNRCEAMQASMADYLAGKIMDHGYQGDGETLHSLIHWDVVLNSQGLDAWLSWLERNQ